MSATLNTLFGIVLINLSNNFLNILYDSELRISKLNLFHPLIVKGKKNYQNILIYKKSVWCYYYCDLDRNGHLVKYICRDSQGIYFLKSYKKCIVFLTNFTNLNTRNLVPGTVFPSRNL